MIDQETFGRFLEDVGRDAALVLIPLFIDEAEARVMRLRAACEAGDLDGAERDAHALKSSARTYGLAKLGSAAASLESACREGRLPAARDEFEAIERLSGASMEALRDFVETASLSA